MTPGVDPVEEVALPHALVRAASTDPSVRALHVRRPVPHVVAFGRAETHRPGFPAAVAAARARGFTPVVRAVGGRAVAWGEHAVVADVVAAEPRPNERMRERFVTAGDALAAALRAHGVDAQVGDVPGEYCPGAHSVNARGTAKLVGTAQRVVRDAWLLSAVVLVADADAVRPVLREVYAALEHPFDESSVGTVRDEAPHLDETAVVALVRDALAPLAPGAGPPDERARRLVGRIRPEHVLQAP